MSERLAREQAAKRLGHEAGCGCDLCVEYVAAFVRSYEAAAPRSSTAGRTPAVEGRSDGSDNPTNGRERLEQAESLSDRRSGSGPTPPPLAGEPRILDLFLRDLRRLGVVGEERAAATVFLALVSRLLPGEVANRPVSVVIKGATSSGKSRVAEAVVGFFPERAVVRLASSSALHLLYAEPENEASLANRFLYVPEWASISAREDLVALLRVLVSEGRIEHGTVEGNGRREARLLRKTGPIGLLMTTTAARVDPELETRMLSLRTDDSPAQTARILAAVAELEAAADHEQPEGVDLTGWRSLNEWLATGERRVAVPFAPELARLMPTTATRLRRDFASLLSLVRAHALLHRATRGRDGEGRVVATLDDYAARGLVADLIAESADAFVPAAIRDNVEAVRELLDGGAEHATVRAVQDRLRIGRGACHDRVRRALAAGYLVNVAAGRRGVLLRLGHPLPADEGPFLPSRETVGDAVVGSLSDRRSDKTSACSSASRGVVGLSDPSDRTSAGTPQAGDNRACTVDNSPRLGDPGVHERLGAAWRAGLITGAERRAPWRVHRHLTRMRRARA